MRYKKSFIAVWILVSLYIAISIFFIAIGVKPIVILKNPKTFFLLEEFAQFLFPQPQVIGFYGGSWYVYGIISIFLCILFFSLSLLKFLLRQRNLEKEEVYLKKMVFVIVVGVVGVISFFQLYFHATHYFLHYSGYNKKTSFEKHFISVGPIYYYALKCQSHMKDGHYNAKLITDVDTSQSLGMTYQRRLAYYLYPIRIRFGEENINPDYLVIFEKINAENSVLEGYKVLFKFNEKNLFAIRKDLL
jgi:hypothetical protein